MIRIIRSDERYLAEHGWLTSRFSFSFAEYYDPKNIRFGPMRVLNDDIIQPDSGFGMHPHSEMEIVTYMISGELLHQDSAGNREVLRAGELQRMSAGTGIYHSETNPSAEQPAHLLQMWFLPDTPRLTPSYEQKGFPREAKINKLLPVVSNRNYDGNLHIHQDMTIYLSILEAGRQIAYQTEAGRRTHLFVIDGQLTLNGKEKMDPGDAARIEGETELALAADSGAEFMLIDLP
ncbi:pirin family protein [Effusibacillus pohliae]|uniref:pirin family protein n=1 Tax=Effusibacillus pohliae TaxID=232270 RepID=UPI00038268FB|nr:pirin family protein [Effusibacillus pohliae]